jgi:hypothetical protein
MRLTTRPHAAVTIHRHAALTVRNHFAHRERSDRERRCGERSPRPARRLGRLIAGLLTAAVALGVLLVPSVAVADPAHTVAVAGSVGTVLNNIRNWIMGILAGLATVFLTIGGVRYVMAGGDPGEVQKAKIAFKSAGIGYGLAALAPLVVTVLKGIVGA